MVLRPMPAGGSPTSARPSVEQRVAGARLAWRLECYSKPTISLIDVPVSGYLAGLVMNGTHRVAGEGYRLRVVPEDLLGAADGGLAHWLAHLKPGIGAYLVATGLIIGPAEALRFGLVTHTIPAARFGEIEAGLAAADPVDPLLDDRQAAHFPTVTPTVPEQTLDRIIASCFTSPRLVAILDRLASHAGVDGGQSARAVRAAIEQTAAGGLLERALARLEAAATTDMRSTLIAGFAAADPASPPVHLPTRSEHQALRDR
jgi:enoyl-CoA hydratase